MCTVAIPVLCRLRKRTKMTTVPMKKKGEKTYLKGSGSPENQERDVFSGFSKKEINKENKSRPEVLGRWHICPPLPFK